MNMEKIKVLLFQTDNRRDLDYLGLTKKVNEESVKYLNREQEKIEYLYLFYLMENSDYENLHPATGKINVVNKLLNGNIASEMNPDIIVFLDSDAWIQNPFYLHDLIQLLLESGENKQGCFSRDPYLSRNDYINSGSFIIKKNEYMRTMYKEIKNTLNIDSSHHHGWSYDQYYISREIYKRKDDFLIFTPPIINTPEGQIIRHHWYKTHTMYGDLYHLLDIHNPYVKPNEPFSFSDKMDDRPYPNPNTYDYEYHR